MAVYVTREESSPIIDWCTLHAANCVHSRCFCPASLFIRLCICLFITTYIYFFFVCLCVHLVIYNKLISSYFSAWSSHSGRFNLLFLSGCALFFHSYLLLMSLHFSYQEHNKDCCCCYEFGNEKDRWSW